MSRVTMVDTSVLCNLLQVPNKSQQVEDVLMELDHILSQGVVLLLPIAAVIETGNHVLQIKDGRVRRTVAAGYASLLRATADGEAPWIPNEIEWNRSLIRRMTEGVDTGMPLSELLAQEVVGGGDISILAEREDYRRRTGIGEVSIWTYDQKLGVYNN